MCSCPSRTDEPYEGEGFNQSPNHLAADLTTNQDLNGIANDREVRNPGTRAIAGSSQALEDKRDKAADNPPADAAAGGKASGDGMLPSIAPPDGVNRDAHRKTAAVEVAPIHPGATPPPGGGSGRQEPTSRVARLKKILLDYAQFIGPGFMISVAYSASPLSTLWLCPTALKTPTDSNS